MTLRKKLLAVIILVALLAGNLRWFLSATNMTTSSSHDDSNTRPSTTTTTNTTNGITTAFHTHENHNPRLVIDIVSIGSTQRPDYQTAQQETFGRHASVRHFWAIQERHDPTFGTSKDCNTHLTWRDVQNISGFCGGQRTNIKTKHKFLFELKNKFAKPEWLQRTKTNPVAWLCAQKRPMAGFQVAMQSYTNTPLQSQPSSTTASSTATLLPDFLIIMDDDTYYNMEAVAQGLLALEQEHQTTQMVVAGCVIRSRNNRIKFKVWNMISYCMVLCAVA